MKKDIFNEKIAAEYKGMVKVTLILTPAVFIFCGVFLLLIAIFYNNIEYDARVFTYILATASICAGVAYPFITLYLIRIYPKHRKVTRQFLQENVFRKDNDWLKKYDKN